MLPDFEDSIDAKLRPVDLSGKYFGSYDGYDKLADEYRMFFSCPDADELLEFVRGEVEMLRWPSSARACVRYGRMYEEEVPEKMSTI